MVHQKARKRAVMVGVENNYQTNSEPFCVDGNRMCPDSKGKCSINAAGEK